MEQETVDSQFCRILGKTEGAIRFEVDENLVPDNRKLYWSDPAERLAFYHIDRHGDSSKTVDLCHISFSDADRIHYYGKDPFFQMMCVAYGCHRPVILSPDVVWLLICQGFGRYVHKNARRLRHLLVNHKDVAIVEVRSGTTDPETADWDRIVQMFADKLSEKTKGGLSSVITADFTTTGAAERVASQITLMNAVKPYCEYVHRGYICGIPSITLKGTPEDWEKVYLKTKTLAEYGVSGWVRKLYPILREFIKAAEGKPRKSFWKSIVKRYRPQQIRGRGCAYNSGKLTSMDGWILRLFPDGETCQVPERVPFDKDMPSEMVAVPMKFQVSDGSNVIDQCKMDLYAGIVGLTENANLALEAKVGWFVCRKKK